VSCKSVALFSLHKLQTATGSTGNSSRLAISQWY